MKPEVNTVIKYFYPSSEFKGWFAIFYECGHDTFEDEIGYSLMRGACCHRCASFNRAAYYKAPRGVQNERAN